MLDKDLLQMALGFESPWFVEAVDFDAAEKRVDIAVSFPKGSRFTCPTCGQVNRPIHDTLPKTWRHLDFFQHQAFLYAKVPRIDCDKCGVKLIEVNWARSGSSFTLLFEVLVLQMAQHMAVSAVAGIVRQCPDSIWRILNHYVEKARQKQDLTGVTAIAIDETSRRKGHRYVTIVCDLDRSRVLYVTKGKEGRTVGDFVEDFQARGGDIGQIQEVAVDMSAAFTAGITEHLPDATITYDHYHVMALVNEAVDKVRREETEAQPLLKKSRYIWLKNPKDLSEKDTQRLDSLASLHLKTGRAYQMKLALQKLWTYKHPFFAERYLKKWYFWATHSRLEPMKAVAGTIKRHWDGILRFIRSRITTGKLEGINGKIKAAARRAFGFKSFEYYRTIIYLIAGKLELPVPA